MKSFKYIIAITFFLALSIFLCMFTVCPVATMLGIPLLLSCVFVLSWSMEQKKYYSDECKLRTNRLKWWLGMTLSGCVGGVASALILTFFGNIFDLPTNLILFVPTSTAILGILTYAATVFSRIYSRIASKSSPSEKEISLWKIIMIPSSLILGWLIIMVVLNLFLWIGRNNNIFIAELILLFFPTLGASAFLINHYRPGNGSQIALSTAIYNLLNLVCYLLYTPSTLFASDFQDSILTLHNRFTPAMPLLLSLSQIILLNSIVLLGVCVKKRKALSASITTNQ